MCVARGGESAERGICKTLSRDGGGGREETSTAGKKVTTEHFHLLFKAFALKD